MPQPRSSLECHAMSAGCYRITELSILYIRPVQIMISPMKHMLSVIGFIILTATAAQGACYADYKAKQDGPLKLHYGVAKISDGACPSNSRVQATLKKRLAAGGWSLLSVQSTFDESQLDRRRGNAGQFFLRY